MDSSEQSAPRTAGDSQSRGSQRARSVPSERIFERVLRRRDPRQLLASAAHGQFHQSQNRGFTVISCAEEKVVQHANTRVFVLLDGLSMSQAWKHDPVIKPPGLSIKNNHETNVYVRGSRLLPGASQSRLSCASANPAPSYPLSKGKRGAIPGVLFIYLFFHARRPTCNTPTRAPIKRIPPEKPPFWNGIV